MAIETQVWGSIATDVQTDGRAERDLKDNVEAAPLKLHKVVCAPKDSGEGQPHTCLKTSGPPSVLGKLSRMSGYLKVMKDGVGISFPPSPWNGQGLRGSASCIRERKRPGRQPTALS